MKKLRFVLSFLLCVGLLMSSVIVSGCGTKNVLKVYNCYDYIDEDLLEEFEEDYKLKTGIDIKVEYSCFDTPEDAYNNLKINGSSYDLVCPSDYMIEKMAREDMLQKFTLDEHGNYNTYVSPYIKDVFDSITWGGGEKLSNYAAGYMWGTLGLVYNPNKVNEDDMKTWGTLWTSEYNKRFTIKDSVRDTFFIGLAKQFENELKLAKDTYALDNDLAKYQSALKGYFNNTEDATITAVSTTLINLAKNCRNLEIDDGKEDVIKGNVDVYFAWSGDAVYAIDVAEENDVELKYAVPEEGSNVWFDGWVIPKESTKTEEAKAFIEFLSKPENAIANMEEIGYVSVIAGDEVFENVKKYSVKPSTYTLDLGYFFGEGDYKIGIDDLYGKCVAQYPPKEVVDRCVVMNYFEPEANKNINNMWINVKSNIS